MGWVRNALVSHDGAAVGSDVGGLVTPSSVGREVIGASDGAALGTAVGELDVGRTDG